MTILRAELKKLTGNPMLISFTLWVFPVGIAAFMVIGLVLALILPEAARAMSTTSSGSWVKDMAAIWQITSSFPANVFGRLLPLAFMATAFAGEYAWGTLRLALPRVPRTRLLFNKSLSLVLLISLAFVLTSLLLGIGQTALHSVLGLDYGPTLSSTALADFGSVYGREMLLGVLSLCVLVGMAATAAVVTRSILGGLLASFGFSVLEPMSFMVLLLIQRVFGWAQAMNLYRFTPSYNLDNARAWMALDHGFLQPGMTLASPPSLAVSLLWLLFWIGLLFGAAALVFQRQDIHE